MASSFKGNAPVAVGPLDVFEAAKAYVTNKCMETVSGIKSLLLDDETAASVGLVVSHTKALHYQVYAIDRLDNSMRKPVGHIKALCIIRPTQENVKVLQRELSEPRFEEYHIFFTNTLPDHLLKDLALSDVGQVVRQVQEIFLDFCPLGPELFTLNVPRCVTTTHFFALFDCNMLACHHHLCFCRACN